ncbi:MAG: RNA-guided endonuclease TnpB family protein [Eubacteriales bacterium]
MKILQAYKFELMPNGEQRRNMRRFAGACRYVYNRALDLQQESQRVEGGYIRYEEIAKWMPLWKRDTDTAWLKEPPSQALQQTLMDLNKSFQKFFKKQSGYPKFKKKGQHDSFRFPDAKQLKLEESNKRVFLPKLGWIRYRKSRDIEGIVRNATVSLRGGKWYISIQTQREVDEPVHPSQSIVGIDVGISKFAALSTGEVIVPVHSLRHMEQKLAKLQRQLAKKKKGSRNASKIKHKIQKCHIRIANVRNDHLHKTTTMLSKNHAVLVVEDLQVKEMSQSAKGTIENPGRNAKAKTKLNKSILDQGWGEFVRQVTYKEQWMGGRVIKIAPQYTSQRCSCCGHTAKENRTTQARFCCTECGHTENADVNAAKNIEAAGRAVLARGEMTKVISMKQDPSEAIQALA